MDIDIELEKILEKKGVTPPGMTGEQFFREFGRRMEMEVGPALEDLTSRILCDIAHDEMAKVGRIVPCRYAGHARDKLSKHCSKPPDCCTCLGYKPIPGWQHWLTKPKNLEILVIAAAALSFIAALICRSISAGVLGIWFALVVFTQVNNYILYKKLWERKD